MATTSRSGRPAWRAAVPSQGPLAVRHAREHRQARLRVGHRRILWDPLAGIGEQTGHLQANIGRDGKRVRGHGSSFQHPPSNPLVTKPLPTS